MYILRIFLENLFSYIGASNVHAVQLAQITLVICILLCSLFLVWILNRVLVPIILKIVSKTPTKWDDYLINAPVLRSTCRLLPSLLVYNLLPLCFDNYDGLSFTILNRLTCAYIALSAMLLIGTFLRNVTYVLSYKMEEHHFVGIFQFIRVLNVVLGIIVIVSLLFGSNPIRIIAGMGAAVTVLMLVFKDTILGLVASIQLSVNKMLKVGDWITIDKLGINGIVEDISLTTIKVRNFDNTISTVPPYSLISDSFQNWDGMEQSGQRRVKRSLYIDIRSIHFCTDDEKERLNHKKLISKNDMKEKSITNLTLFRHWIIHFLEESSAVSKKQWILARQLDPTPNGLPLELWFYLLETRFEPFEDQASIFFEQIIAIMPEFELQFFQSPSGNFLIPINTSSNNQTIQCFK